jgi:hypothetical protein
MTCSAANKDQASITTSVKLFVHILSQRPLSHVDRNHHVVGVGSESGLKLEEWTGVFSLSFLGCQ